MNALGTLHQNLVFKRRTEVLARGLAETIPPGATTVLDVGCGDGTIDALIQRHRPELAITGVDVLVRPGAHIPVQAFNGTELPFPDNAFDVVMFVDVLHNTDDPATLLREAWRVARTAVVLKDHTRESRRADLTLRFMDWVGNAHHGVRLPYNYWPSLRWRDAFARIGLSAETWRTDLGLYPFPASLLFERNLHFMARLGVR